jgi:hypothetical protein
MANNYIKTGRKRGPVSAIEKVLRYGVWLTVEEIAAKTGKRPSEIVRQLTNHPLADCREMEKGFELQFTLQTRASRCP